MSLPHIHTRRFGQGPRAALAVHCTLAHSGSLGPLCEGLGDRLSTQAFDLPDHGGSGAWDKTGNLHDVATDMARSLIDEPVDLIGHSFGATVALRLAIESPELVRSCTMIEPVYWAAALQDDPESLAAHVGPSKEFDAAFAAGDTFGAARIFNRDWGDGTKWADFPAKAQEYMAKRIHFVPASSPFLGDDSAGLLREGMFERAHMPCLLIQGGTSAALTEAINTSLARRLPNAQRATIKGAGHMAPMTHAAEVAQVIGAFLDTLENAQD